MSGPWEVHHVDMRVVSISSLCRYHDCGGGAEPCGGCAYCWRADRVLVKSESEALALVSWMPFLRMFCPAAYAVPRVERFDVDDEGGAF